MIKAVGEGRNGKPLLILGLEEPNMDLLRQGRPITIDGGKLGLSVDVRLQRPGRRDSQAEGVRA